MTVSIPKFALESDGMGYAVSLALPLAAAVPVVVSWTSTDTSTGRVGATGFPLGISVFTAPDTCILGLYDDTYADCGPGWNDPRDCS